MEVQAIAKVCHEANRAVQRFTGEQVSEPWELLDDETRDSAVDGVEFSLAGASPRDSHENWTRFKEENGWVYGEVKNLDAKEHPCLVDYEDLPPEQRLKDDIFVTLVRTLAGTMA